MTKRKVNTKGKTELGRANAEKIINAAALALGKKLQIPDSGTFLLRPVFSEPYRLHFYEY
jgi:hypothetical protein